MTITDYVLMNRDKHTTMALPTILFQEIKEDCKSKNCTFNSFVVRALATELERIKNQKEGK